LPLCKLQEQNANFQTLMFIPEPGREYPKETESRVTIRFQDCDPLKHLNNAKYFDYFFNAREDQVAHLYNFNAGQLFRELGSGWVAYHSQIAYIRPAVFGEWVRIMSSVVSFSEDSLLVEYYMTDDAKEQLKTVLWSTLKYVDAQTGKRIPHHAVVADYLQAICLHHTEIQDFNKRIKEIKSSLL
jgi:acyl-CoA thioester hydrolase